MDLRFTLFYYFFFIFIFYEPFMGYKEDGSFFVRDGKFLGWEDFFPRVNKEIHC